MLSFRIYRDGEELQATAVYDHSFAENTGIFVENGLSFVSELKLGTTGINDQQIATFSIFPNPGNGKFSITLSNEGTYNLSVLNSQGLQMFTTAVSGSQNLDLSALSKGVYFIRLSNASSVSVEKLVIR